MLSGCRFTSLPIVVSFRVVCDLEVVGGIMFMVLWLCILLVCLLGFLFVCLIITLISVGGFVMFVWIIVGFV